MNGRPHNVRIAVELIPPKWLGEHGDLDDGAAFAFAEK